MLRYKQPKTGDFEQNADSGKQLKCIHSRLLHDKHIRCVIVSTNNI